MRGKGAEAPCYSGLSQSSPARPHIKQTSPRFNSWAGERSSVPHSHLLPSLGMTHRKETLGPESQFMVSTYLVSGMWEELEKYLHELVLYHVHCCLGLYPTLHEVHRELYGVPVFMQGRIKVNYVPSSLV